jgi:hypothetical protein
VCRVGGFLGDDEISECVRIGFARGIVPTRGRAVVCIVVNIRTGDKRGAFRRPSFRRNARARVP